MVAGFLAGYLKTGDYDYALRLGTASGGATAFQMVWEAENDHGAVCTAYRKWREVEDADHRIVEKAKH